MSITYTELSTAVANNLEISTTDTERISRLNIDANLNIIQRELLNVLPKEYLGSAIKTIEGNLTFDVYTYAWPSDFVRFIRLLLDYDGSITTLNLGREAVEYNQEEHVLPMHELALNIFPMVDVNDAAGFRIAPTPFFSITDGYQLKYVYQLPDISSGQDSLMHPRFKGLLVDGATARSAAQDNYRPDLAAFFQNKYDTALAAFLPKEDKKPVKRRN